MKKRLKLLTTIVLAFLFFWFPLCALAMAECIGVVTAGGGIGFWTDVEKGAQKAGKELGVTVYTRGAVDETDVEGQRKALNFMIKRGCRGLVLAPNSEERKADVARLKAQGIPTVYIDRDKGGDRICVIKTNNTLAGEVAGREMVKRLNGKGRIAVFRVNRNVTTTVERELGFIREAEKGGLEIVADCFIGNMVGKTRIEAEKILKKAIGINGVFTSNEATTLGTVKALESLKKAGKITHIGFDSNKIIIKSLQAGNLHGFVVQRPFEMGYTGVHTVYQAMQGKPVKEYIETDIVFVSNENIADSEIKDILGM